MSEVKIGVEAKATTKITIGCVGNGACGNAVELRADGLTSCMVAASVLANSSGFGYRIEARAAVAVDGEELPQSLDGHINWKPDTCSPAACASLSQIADAVVENIGNGLTRSV